MEMANVQELGNQIKRRAHMIFYIALLVSLYILDSYSTYYLVVNDIAYETNPLVQTSSLTTIFFSPIPFAIFALCIASVITSETNPVKTAFWIRENWLLSFLISSPYFMLCAKAFAVSSNFSIVFGGDDFISWLSIFVGDDIHIGTLALSIVTATILYPIIGSWLKTRFPLPVDQTDNERD